MEATDITIILSNETASNRGKPIRQERAILAEIALPGLTEERRYYAGGAKVNE